MFKTFSRQLKYSTFGLLSFAAIYSLTNSRINSDSFAQISVDEFIKHKTPEDIWIAIDKKVYDLSNFVANHPGGASAIMKYAGKDATKAFRGQHAASILNVLPEESFLGVLDGHLEVEKTEDELRIEAAHLAKPPLSMMFNVNDFEAVAKQLIPRDLYIYFATGADDEATLRESHLAYSRVFFRPKILTNVSSVDFSTTMLGQKVDTPFYVTSFAGQRLLHPDGEQILARLAKKHNFMFIVPRLTSTPIPELIKLVGEDTPLWCQVHSTDKDPTLSKLFGEVNKYEQIKGIFISTDCATAGNREKDFKVRQEVVDFDPSLNTYATTLKTYPNITWDDVIRLKKTTTKKVVLKGVQRTEDVLKACEIGLDGVVLSSHGGRQLDFSQPPLEVLAEAMPILKQQAYYDKEKFQVFIDGGIRRGSDMVKAIALGATGAGMGKAFAFALASYGEEGAEKLIDNLKLELTRDMKLLGVTDLAQLDASYVNIKGLYNRMGNYADSYFRNYEPLPVPKFVK